MIQKFTAAAVDWPRRLPFASVRIGRDLLFLLRCVILWRMKTNTGGLHMNAVIFDMDGVLVDSERVVWESFRYAGEKTGVPDVERMAIIGLGLNDEAWIKRFRQEFGADSDRILEHEEALSAEFLRQAPHRQKKARTAAGAAVRVGYPGCSRVVVSGGRRARPA